jgi:hypothetical protein
MCLPGQGPGGPASAADAVVMARAGLGWLAGADAASLTSAEQAECLRALAQSESMHAAARASVLRAFTAGRGYEDDGHGSAKTWLRWQTQISSGAAGAAMGWMRRLAAHPAVHDALAGGQVSVSFARQICEWTDLLPGARRADADAILLAAAAGGAELADLAALAEEMRKRTARPDTDSDDDGFADRWVRLETTFGGAGSLEGDLTPQCTAALAAVLESLGAKAGPEDVRTKGQRDHDALEEVCRRLIAAGCLPERAGQPTQIQLHLTLDQLRGLDQDGSSEAAWAARGPAAPPGADCDATIVPVVSGHVDPDVLDRLAAALLSGTPPAGGTGSPSPADSASETGVPGRLSAARWRRSQRAARQIILRAAADLLSGPAGLAAFLRTGALHGLEASVSLPLDIGTTTETIPVHLRRAVTARDRHCRFPGCRQPPAACHPHHIAPRAKGGPTSLTNMLLLCTFHHLIAVHRWGWGITLHPDGTTSATSPDGRKHSTATGHPQRRWRRPLAQNRRLTAAQKVRLAGEAGSIAIVVSTAASRPWSASALGPLMVAGRRSGRTSRTPRCQVLDQAQQAVAPRCHHPAQRSVIESFELPQDGVPVPVKTGLGGSPSHRQ